MSWKEAISRSLRALLAFAIVYVSGFAAIGIGAGLVIFGGITEIWPLFLPAVIFYIFGDNYLSIRRLCGNAEAVHRRHS